MGDDRAAGLELLKTATLIDFEIIETDLAPEGSMKGILQFTEAEDVEWGGLAFVFAIAVISFNEVRPAGHSDIAYAGDDDEFTVGDLVEHFRFGHGRLHIYLDYVRGRLVKTDIDVYKDGKVVIQTVNRGQSLGRPLDLMKGKRPVDSAEFEN
ncbi:MAG: hypothetical protein H0V89_06610 [Deltaproteobacteria bacterium]|nr:hypothetical protein [Deltaproteobacteria bacterium]